jgi:hypothetical protein
MDELSAWLKAEGLTDCAPYLQGMTMVQLIALPSMPQALHDEKPKSFKKLKSAVKAYKKSTFSARTAMPHFAESNTALDVDIKNRNRSHLMH